MSMEQVGTERKLDLVERGHLTTGGSMEETVDKAEVVLFGTGMTLSETPQRAEDVIITNV